MLVHVFPDPERVLHRAQGENTVQLPPRQLRYHGAGAGRQQQSVIGFLKHPPAFQVPHRYRLVLGMDGRDLMVYPDVHVEPRPETLRSLERQFLPIPDNTADVIWQTAVGIRDVAGPFKNQNFRRLIQTADPGGGGGASGHPAYNNYFQNMAPFSGLFQHGF